MGIELHRYGHGRVDFAKIYLDENVWWWIFEAELRDLGIAFSGLKSRILKWNFIGFHGLKNEDFYIVFSGPSKTPKGKFLK